jgi:hypothetical protein
MPTYQVLFTREHRLYFYVEAENEREAKRKAINLPEDEGEEGEPHLWEYEDTYLCDEQGTPV